MFLSFIIKVFTHMVLPFFLIFPQLFFFINIKVITPWFFSFLPSIFKYSFKSSSRLSHIAFFTFFSYFLNCYFSKTLRLSRFAFLVFCPLSLILFLLAIKVITHSFLHYFLVYPHLLFFINNKGSTFCLFPFAVLYF